MNQLGTLAFESQEDDSSIKSSHLLTRRPLKFATTTFWH